MKTIKQLLITIAVLLCSATTYAYDFKDDGIYYNIISSEDLTVEVTSVPYYYDDYSGEVVIPSTVNYNGEVYSVISIGEEAFYNCSGLTSIEIPNSVIAIEDGNHVSDYYGAFERCFNLTTVIFGENSQLTSIGDYAFYNCSSLTNIKIPNSVTSIGKDAFSSCSSLTSVTFGENSQLTSIGGAAFYNCSGLTSIEIPSSVVSIETTAEYGYCIGAFQGCTNLKTVTFEENSQLTSIGDYAFYNCSSLTSIEIPNFVTSIGGGAFYNCSGLTSIEIPNSVVSIESSPNDIGGRDGAFQGCTNLKTVTFEENSQLTSIEHAFTSCSSLTSIEIPNSVTSIGENAFSHCLSLTNIEIPNSVTSIGGAAFYNCSGLTSIEIPNSVVSIESSPNNISGRDGAFQGCTNLKTVTFEENSQLTLIGSCAFRGCLSLTSIEIPNSVTTIGGGTFHKCESLTSIEIPSSVVSIETTAEYGYCIGAFQECSNLKTVTFGENSKLNSIGGHTFSECSSLISIEIPNSVTSIVGGTFFKCESLTSIEIPSSVISIGFYTNLPLHTGAFEECSSLTSIEIPNSVTSIGENAFYGCTSLKDFKIEDGYTTLELGYHLFKNCALETIYLGRNISYDNSENPEDLLFDDMITLKSLTIGSSVTEIPGKTFYDCTNLESVYMRGVPPIISDDTFSNASFYIATLYVPEGTLAFYQAANVWKNFWNIQEYEPTSIEDVEADEVKFTISSNGISFSNANNTTIAIYTINGILVEKIDKYTGEDIFLDKGIYIVSVGNKTMKIKL